MSGLTAQEVEKYLAKHPDFFAGRDGLLLAMQVPHGSRGSVSLVEKQLALLQEGQRGSRERLGQLYESAARNLELFDKTRQLALDLIAAADLEAFLGVLQQGLLRDFGCKAYSLVVFSDSAGALGPHAFLASQEAAREAMGAIPQVGKPALGPLRPKARDFLFPKRGKRIESALALALGAAGLLAIGGEDPQDFTSDMDTLFIDFLAEVIARLLPRHVGAAP